MLFLKFLNQVLLLFSLNDFNLKIPLDLRLFFYMEVNLGYNVEL